MLDAIIFPRLAPQKMSPSREEKGSILLETSLAAALTILLSFFVFKIITDYIVSRQNESSAKYAEDVLKATRGFWGEHFGAPDFSFPLREPLTLEKLKEQAYLPRRFPRSALLKRDPEIISFMSESAVGRGRGRYLNLGVVLEYDPPLEASQMRRVIGSIKDEGVLAGYMEGDRFVGRHGGDLSPAEMRARLGRVPADGALVVISEHPLEGVVGASAKHFDLSVDRESFSRSLGRELERLVSAHEQRLRDRLANFDFAAANPAESLRIRERLPLSKDEKIYEIPMHHCPEDSVAAVNVYDSEGFGESAHIHDGYKSVGGVVRDVRSVDYGEEEPMSFHFRLTEKDGTLSPYLRVPQESVRRFFSVLHSNYQPRRHSAYMSRLGSLSSFGDGAGFPLENPYYRLPPLPESFRGTARALRRNGAGGVLEDESAALEGGILLKREDGAGWILKNFYREDTGPGKGIDAGVFMAHAQGGLERLGQFVCREKLIGEGLLCGENWESTHYTIGNLRISIDSQGRNKRFTNYALPTEASWKNISYCSRKMQSRRNFLGLASFIIEKELGSGERTILSGGSGWQGGLSCDWVPQEDIRVVRKCVADYGSYAKKNPLRVKLRRVSR